MLPVARGDSISANCRSAIDALFSSGVTDMAFVIQAELESEMFGNSTLTRAYSSVPCREVDGKERSSAVSSASLEFLAPSAAWVQVDFVRGTADFVFRARFGLLTLEVLFLVAARDAGMFSMTNS